MSADRGDRRFLRAAARLALRGHGGAEPNPLVGCLIVAAGGAVVGWGCHRRFGGAHAEIEALGRAGPRARGAAVYLTLEPCNHRGKTGPCTAALIEAGVARVVFARRDEDATAGGGAEHLRQAGCEVVRIDGCPDALAVSEPFVHRLRTGLPWVVAKWAQTLDGRVATRAGESRWISGARSRRLVHRERGRVDAILTGIGTVRSDDPLLTARGVRRRRIARRVVIDPQLRTPPAARLVATAGDVPTTIACRASALTEQAEAAAQLRAAGVEIFPAGGEGPELDLAGVLRHLVAAHGAAHVLVEAGPGLTGRLLRAGLVNEAWVFVAPIMLADERAIPCARGAATDHLADALTLEPRSIRRRGDDLVLRYRPAPPPALAGN